MRESTGAGPGRQTLWAQSNGDDVWTSPSKVEGFC